MYIEDIEISMIKNALETLTLKHTVLCPEYVTVNDLKDITLIKQHVRLKKVMTFFLSKASLRSKYTEYRKKKSTVN